MQLERLALERAVRLASSFLSIATDPRGMIQVYNVGAERMLGYRAGEVVGQLRLAHLAEREELSLQASVLAEERAGPLDAGFAALTGGIARGGDEVCDLTCIRKDGTRLAIVLSITALRDAEGGPIGFLFIGTDNSARSRAEAEREALLRERERTNAQLEETNEALRIREEQLWVTLNSIGDAVIATDAHAVVTLINPLAEALTGWSRADALGRRVEEVFRICNESTRERVSLPIGDTLRDGTLRGLANHTIVVSRAGVERSIADSCAPIRGRLGGVIGAVLVFRDVTEEYSAQRAIRDGAALVDTILANVVEGIITFRAHGALIERVNRGVEGMFGFSAQELLGTSFHLLVPEFGDGGGEMQLDHYRVSEADRALGKLRQVVGRAKDGRTFPVEVAVSDMWIGDQQFFIGILRDITARSHADGIREKLDQQLSDQQFYTRSLFESNVDALMATSPIGLITDVNQQTETLTGRSRFELIGTPFQDYFTDPCRAYEGVKLALKDGRVINYELTVRRKDGNETVVSFNAKTFYDQKNRLEGVFAAARDVTEGRRVDQALQERNRELVAARLTADKANLAKSEFLSSMSHELRSPLNAILGFAQLLDSETPPPSPSQKASIAQVLHAGWYLLDLINEILDLSAIESGRLSLSVEPVSLAEVFAECQAMVAPQAELRRLTMQFPSVLGPGFVLADRVRLKQVLINLLTNAIKYNRNGGTVSVECTRAAGERVRVAVRDTGAGLSAEKVNQLFQPFNRLGREGGSEEGTGIGLVVSKLLIEVMGGVIGATSAEGVGSDFWFYLAACDAPDAPPPASGGVSEPSSASGVPQAVRTLLYVEDNSANLALVAALIARRSDLHLLTAGEAALGIRLARERQPQAILMDINLPGMNGIEALALLRADPATAHIPVLALSANAMQSDIDRGLAAGFVRYLTKPINVEAFMNAIDAVLSRNGVVDPS